eukprot:TRINITY_DN9286_c0_g1_i1.p1 TRINITY_DN9286_c0_g1~~TRINITY_DN9286_c0_g1_i1.p1  ORF type:complete len:104 (-),score=9.12 TRINITY_DN9286_c0_g1_i1:698-1009(-)
MNEYRFSAVSHSQSFSPFPDFVSPLCGERRENHSPSLTHLIFHSQITTQHGMSSGIVGKIIKIWEILETSIHLSQRVFTLPFFLLFFFLTSDPIRYDDVKMNL